MVKSGRFAGKRRKIVCEETVVQISSCPRKRCFREYFEPTETAWRDHAGIVDRRTCIPPGKADPSAQFGRAEAATDRESASNQPRPENSDSSKTCRNDRRPGERPDRQRAKNQSGGRGRQLDQ